MDSDSNERKEGKLTTLSGMARSMIRRLQRRSSLSGPDTQAISLRMTGRENRGLVWTPDIGPLSPRMVQNFSQNVAQRYPEIAQKFSIKTGDENNYNPEDLVLPPVGSGFPLGWPGEEAREPAPEPPFATREPEQALEPTPPRNISANPPIQRRPGVRPVSRIEEITTGSRAPERPGGFAEISRLPSDEATGGDDLQGKTGPDSIKSTEPPVARPEPPGRPAMTPAAQLSRSPGRQPLGRKIEEISTPSVPRLAAEKHEEWEETGQGIGPVPAASPAGETPDVARKAAPLPAADELPLPPPGTSSDQSARLEQPAARNEPVAPHPARPATAGDQPAAARPVPSQVGQTTSSTPQPIQRQAEVEGRPAEPPETQSPAASATHLNDAPLEPPTVFQPQTGGPDAQQAAAGIHAGAPSEPAELSPEIHRRPEPEGTVPPQARPFPQVERPEAGPGSMPPAGPIPPDGRLSAQTPGAGAAQAEPFAEQPPAHSSGAGLRDAPETAQPFDFGRTAPEPQVNRKPQSPAQPPAARGDISSEPGPRLVPSSSAQSPAPARPPEGPNGSAIQRKTGERPTELPTQAGTARIDLPERETLQPKTSPAVAREGEQKTPERTADFVQPAASQPQEPPPVFRKTGPESNPVSGQAGPAQNSAPSMPGAASPTQPGVASQIPTDLQALRRAPLPAPEKAGLTETPRGEVIQPGRPTPAVESTLHDQAAPLSSEMASAFRRPAEPEAESHSDQSLEPVTHLPQAGGPPLVSRKTAQPEAVPSSPAPDGVEAAPPEAAQAPRLTLEPPSRPVQRRPEAAQIEKLPPASENPAARQAPNSESQAAPALRKGAPVVQRSHEPVQSPGPEPPHREASGQESEASVSGSGIPSGPAPEGQAQPASGSTPGLENQVLARRTARLNLPVTRLQRRVTQVSQAGPPESIEAQVETPGAAIARRAAQIGTMLPTAVLPQARETAGMPEAGPAATNLPLPAPARYSYPPQERTLARKAEMVQPAAAGVEQQARPEGEPVQRRADLPLASPVRANFSIGDAAASGLSAEPPLQRSTAAGSSTLQRAELQAPETVEAGVDLDELARQVYPLIKRMIAIERERFSSR